jgi:hypothetical protein
MVNQSRRGVSALSDDDPRSPIRTAGPSSDRSRQVRKLLRAHLAGYAAPLV